MEGEDLNEDLGKRGNKLIEDNIHDKVIYALRGDFGQGLVVTDSAVYVLKWGFQSGLTFGGRCTPYSYSNIITVQIQKKLTSKFLEIITAGNQDKALSYWASRGKSNNAIEAPNAVTFSNKSVNKFQAMATYLNDRVANAKSPHSHPSVDVTSELEKYAELHKKGIITQEEFAAKKKQLLGL